MEPRRHEYSDCDFTSVTVVATAWLLFYGLSFSGYAFKQGAGLLASMFNILT
jgi:hypothetical protein